MVCNQIVRLAFQEDVGTGDITSNLLIPKGLKAKAVIKAKEAGVIAGLEVAKEVFRRVDQRIVFKKKVADGALVKKGAVIAEVSGPARGILTAERTALNFLQHLSGVATFTRKFKRQTANLKAKILDTRKTIPGLRALEKYAVRVGGGVNHRMGLYDAILVKDNHIKLIGQKKALMALKSKKALRGKTAIEVKTAVEARKAIEGGAKRLLLDNMNLKTLRKVVKLCRKAGIITEASGGVNLQNVRLIAKTGVDYISIGALTHSAPALDISLKVV